MGVSEQKPNAIIIGAGPSGIALSHALKHDLGFNDFTVYDKMDGAGGTWRANTYPGCGCDVPMQLYSFSFNLNPDWPQDLCDQKAILQYLDDTVDKFHIRQHMQFNVECISAKWLTEQNEWEVKFRNNVTNVEFTRHATIFVSAVGGLSSPKDVPFPGRDSFKGESFHTARWNDKYDITGKRMAIIGNGCSAVQLLPNVLDKVAYVKQYARSAQWYHDRPNRVYTPFERWCFRYVPFYQRYIRYGIFSESESVVDTYIQGETAAKKRQRIEQEAKEYILQRTPKKYHSFIVPDFPLGCKRRIFDPGYLVSLQAPNVELVNEGIARITENGIVGTSGKEDHFDVIIHATGFKLSEFLAPMEVYGARGVSLTQHWKENGGAQAYFGTYINDFPNFAVIFGPNTVPAHGSALFMGETQASYIVRSLVAPILDRRASTIAVKQIAVNEHTLQVHKKLAGSVFAASCSNWYHDSLGRNVANWPRHCLTFWWLTRLPQKKSFIILGGSNWGYLNAFGRWTSKHAVAIWATLFLFLGANFLAGTKVPSSAGSLWAPLQSILALVGLGK